MNKNILKGITLAAAAILGATAVWAVPPPVPQTHFIKDTPFAAFKLADCHDCHGADDTAGNYALAQKHHALIFNNRLNITASCYNVSGTLPATIATGCHLLTQTGVVRPDGTIATSIVDVTNCLSCHTQSPHHLSSWAAAQDCQHCHGNAIDNPLDGHAIPTYPMDTTKGGITPAPVGRHVVDPNNPGQTIIVQGCEACHQANPANVGFPIGSNEDTHHGTNLGFGPVGACQWCHAPTGSVNAFTIRACEACHGIPSLHSIQWDSPNASSLGTIKPGAEDPGYGHIGSNFDCQGCHSGWQGVSVDQSMTITAPSISGLSTPTVIVGQAANLTINGDGFTNVGSTGTPFTPVVTIKGTSETVTLTPFSFTQSEVQVALPTTLPVGVYELRINKSGSNSNLAKLTVAPVPLQISSVVSSGTTLTIAGKGFGVKPPAEFGDLMGVFVDKVPAKIVSWTDTRVVAATTFAVPAGKPVIVKALNGAAAGNATVAVKKAR